MCNCIGAFGLPAVSASSSVGDAVQEYSSSRRDQPLLSPAKFKPTSSKPSSGIRPPSKWSPVSLDWSRSALGSKTNKTGIYFCIILIRFKRVALGS